MVALGAGPRVNFYSNLPGTPPYQVPVGAAVEVTFEEAAPGQLIHEWRVVVLFFPAQSLLSGAVRERPRPADISGAEVRMGSALCGPAARAPGPAAGHLP